MRYLKILIPIAFVVSILIVVTYHKTIKSTRHGKNIEVTPVSYMASDSFTFVPQIGYSGPVNSLVITPDGKFIVSGNGRLLSPDSAIQMWWMRDRKLLTTLVATPDGSWAVGAPNNLWDADESKKPAGLNRPGTLELYRPGDPEYDRLHYPGLLACIREHGEVPPVSSTKSQGHLKVGENAGQNPFLPELWLPDAGVSGYRNSNLQFMDDDAIQFLRFMEAQDGGMYVHEMVILMNEEVTKNSMLTAIRQLLKQVPSDDVITLFFYGDSVKDGIAEQYYFIPYDMAPENLTATALPVATPDAACRAVSQNVNKFLIYLDKCHSEGEYSKEDRGYKLPYERKGHGAFTYVILKGFEGEADKNGDGIITVMELSNYVSDYVPKITDGLQHPYLRGEGTDMPIFKLE